MERLSRALTGGFVSNALCVRSKGHVAACKGEKWNNVKEKCTVYAYVGKERKGTLFGLQLLHYTSAILRHTHRPATFYG